MSEVLMNAAIFVSIVATVVSTLWFLAFLFTGGKD